jgi:hypothetical protein
MTLTQMGSVLRLSFIPLLLLTPDKRYRACSKWIFFLAQTTARTLQHTGFVELRADAVQPM